MSIHDVIQHDTSSLKGNISLQAWSDMTQDGFTKLHTFGCLVHYLMRGAEKGKHSEKYAYRTVFGIFVGMPSGQPGYLVWEDILASNSTQLRASCSNSLLLTLNSFTLTLNSFALSWTF